MRVIAAASILTLMAGAAYAAPIATYDLPDIEPTLKAGTGSEVAQENCTVCHSVDYILTQPPEMGPKFWDGIVDKMTNVMKAPIAPDDAATIKTYLVNTYGKP